MTNPQIGGARGVWLLALGLVLSAGLLVPTRDRVAPTGDGPKRLPRPEGSGRGLPEPVLVSGGVTVGKASWYGPRFHGRPTASGVAFNRYALTAASRHLRPGTLVRVTNLRNQRSTVLLINDWGPVPEDRIIDVSEAAAAVLGFHQQGLAPVRVEVYSAALYP